MLEINSVLPNVSSCSWLNDLPISNLLRIYSWNVLSLQGNHFLTVVSFQYIRNYFSTVCRIPRYCRILFRFRIQLRKTCTFTKRDHDLQRAFEFLNPGIFLNFNDLHWMWHLVSWWQLYGAIVKNLVHARIRNKIGIKFDNQLVMSLTSKCVREHKSGLCAWGSSARIADSLLNSFQLKQKRETIDFLVTSITINSTFPLPHSVGLP